jgi:hypothetical protein
MSSELLKASLSKAKIDTIRHNESKSPEDESQDSSVGTETSYMLYCPGSIRCRSKNFSLLHRVQDGSGAHTTTYAVDVVGSFLRDKATEALSSPLISI